MRTNTFFRTFGLLLLGLATTIRAQAAAPAAAEPPPTVEQLKTLLAQEKYQDVLRGVARGLSAKRPRKVK